MRISSKLAVAATVVTIICAAACNPFGIAQDSPVTEESTSRHPSVGELGGSDRYLTHISTDKPIYRPGEPVFLRAVILHQESRRPLEKDVLGTIEIKGPKGEVVLQSPVAAVDSVFGYRWMVPQDQAGGQYKVRISPSTGDAPAERTFEVRAYRPPRLRSQINFLSKGYSEGELVTAFLKTERAEGGTPAGAKVTIVARIDGNEVFRDESHVDDSGHCMARFELPDSIERGEGTLAMIIEDGGSVETASKTIPILLQHVDLQVYPEGGSLVAGLSSRVYLEAFTPSKKPADISGVVVDQRGNQVATFQTEHEGRGRFTFTPEDDRTYYLEVQKPSGIELQFPLPKVIDAGVSLSTTANVYPYDERILVDIASSVDSDYVITLSHRGRELDSVDVHLDRLENRRITLNPQKTEGVLVATVWTKLGVAQAERLLFRQPKQLLHIAVTPDSTEYVPGGKAKLTITTTDASGSPVSGVVGITVTDDSVLEMIETRDQSPRLPAMVYLENDVLDLADADVYMDVHNEAAPLAVDLLLGTQGWRRFVVVDINQAIRAYGDATRRALAIRQPDSARRLKSRRLFLQKRGNDVFFADEPVEELAEVDGVNLNPLHLEERLLAESNLAAVGADPDAVNLQNIEKPEQLAIIADLDDANGDGAFGVPPVAVAEQGLLRQKRASASLARRPSLQELTQAVFRQYAHNARPNRRPNQRADFTETLFWSAATKTNEDGIATIEFDLSDSVTSFKVVADAFTTAGTIGSGTATIESVEPFYVEPKIPLEVTSGDFLQIPLSLVNATNAAMNDGLLSIDSNSWKSSQSAKKTFDLASRERARRILGVRIGRFHGEANLTLSATAGAYSDQVTRKLVVKPQGFPTQQAFGGIINREQSVQHVVTIPDNVVAESVKSKIAVHASPLASMTEALAGLIREPNGCFEQTSSSNFPLVMAQQYFQSHVGVDADLITRSAEMLDQGYTKLIGFECQNNGFEWFGSDPGHDALTAYGLLEFVEMSKVRHVDADMMARTKKWLLDQRDGKGGFQRKTQTLHTWLADPECANSYNTWALLEAGIDADLSTEIEWVKQAVEKTENSYVVALAANIFNKAGDSNEAVAMCRRLAKLLADNGSVTGAKTSVVGSGGEALVIETTALAISAWLAFPEFTTEVERGIKYLSESCKSGRFGSTQSTILALRAIVQYDQSRSKPKKPGTLRLAVDGKQVGTEIPFDESTQEAIELPDFSGLLSPGQHTVTVEMTGGSDMPYSIAIDYNCVTPNSSDACKVGLEVSISDDEISEGDVAEATVVVTNRSDEKLPMPVAVIGIPGGMEIRHEQLKELKSEGRIAAYEVNGREVVLYWRVFLPGDQVELPLSMVASVPGKYSAPASRAYEYYTDEHKQWVSGSTVTIIPK